MASNVVRTLRMACLCAAAAVTLMASDCPPQDTDGDGIHDAADQCPNEPETFNGLDDSDGCPDNVTQVADLDQDGIADHLDQCPNQPEVYNGVFDRDGCPDVVTDLYVAVRQDAEQFWNQVFSLSGRAYSPIRVFQLYSIPPGTSSPCGTSPSAFYCGFEQGIYLEQSFMLNQLLRVGDFAPATIIAHEFGHHVQALLGTISVLPPIQKELQADCYAGAWAAWVASRGLLEPGDLQEGAYSLFMVGDPAGTPWFHPSAHGTPQQRVNAFAYGFANGAFLCP